MHDAGRVSRGEPLCSLQESSEHRRPFTLRLLKPLTKVGTIDVFHGHEGPLSDLSDLKDGDHIWMTEGGHRRRLASQPCSTYAVVGAHSIFAQDLERYTAS